MSTLLTLRPCLALRAPLLGLVIGAALFAGSAGTAYAQTFTSSPTGAPPGDAKALVTEQKAKDQPKFEKPTDSTTATISAGGMQTAGNARFLAATGNGAFEIRRGQNGFGTGVLGNYGRTAIPGSDWETTAQNVQARIRYDRYLTDSLSAFLIATGRHDKFQGINFRLNLDPGFKYLFVREEAYSLWGEAGYDLQIDRRRQEDIDRANAAKQSLPPGVDHSSRLFVGYKHAFNKEVTLSTGLEYLQSFVTSERYRFNYELVFAAKVKGGVAVGLGFTARFDNSPVPGKETLDTATSLNLIYAFSDAKTVAKPACPVCPEAPPPAVPLPPADCPEVGGPAKAPVPPPAAVPPPKDAPPPPAGAPAMQPAPPAQPPAPAPAQPAPPAPKP